jgi:GrpB-like predicted nucleotidyltransferase (UPF0157 family)
MNPQNPPTTLDGRAWRNPDDDPIVIAEPQPDWPERYRDEVRRIDAVLAEEGLRGLRYEHFGSTSVPGLAAKPIIDIMLLPPPGMDWQRLAWPFERLGYEHERDNDDPPRMFFIRRQHGHRSHHVHVMTLGEADMHLRIRNHLRSHPADAEQYAALKRNLAASHVADREAYTRGKSAFIASLLGLASHSQEPPDIQGAPR